MTTTKITTTTTISGERVTLALMRDFVDKTSDLPATTEVQVRAGSDQRDGSWFNFTITRTS